MNKKGSEKINAGMFLLYLLIIGVGVVITLGSFLGSHSVDVRGQHSRILYDRIMNCLVFEGFLNEGVFLENYSVFSNCSINKNMIDSNMMYFEFTFLNETDGKIKTIFGGNPQERLKKKLDCDVMSGTKSANSISCLFINETYLFLENKEIKNVKIVGWVASDNTGGKV